MNWQYANYESEPDAASRLAMLRLHLAEVSLKIGPDVSQGDASRSSGSLAGYREQLARRLAELERRAAMRTAGRASVMRRA